MAEHIQLTIRPADLRLLDALAQKFDMSRDHLIRLLIRREASRRSPGEGR